jgi:catechol 2,3-dioxygenase-like lactoylglutathione lyase family enzyme
MLLHGWLEEEHPARSASLGEMEPTMIHTTRTFASFAVDDIDAARSFYGATLGMKVSDEGEHGPLWLHGPDGHDTLVYPKRDHVPATFTVLNFAVDSIEKAVDELAAQGVRFERYEGLESDGRGIYRREGRSTAWFTDPAGNVLSVVQIG